MRYRLCIDMLAVDFDRSPYGYQVLPSSYLNSLINSKYIYIIPLVQFKHEIEVLLSTDD
jgi:hypothetical protein